MLQWLKEHEEPECFKSKMSSVGLFVAKYLNVEQFFLCISLRVVTALSGTPTVLLLLYVNTT